MRLILIRHGLTERNKHSDLIGQDNTEPLSEEGRKQAAALGKRLQAEKIIFKQVYCSPYTRTVETCQVATGLEIDKITMEERLREYSAGVAKDHKRHELITEEVFNQMSELGMHFKWQDGESLYEVQQRTALWLYEVIKTHQHSTDKIAAVSHAMTIKTLLQYIMGFDPKLTWRIDIKNTSMTVLDYKLGHWFIKTINDTGHLKETL